MAAPMRHVCQTLPFDKVKKAIDCDFVNVGFLHILQFCKKLPPGDGNRLMQFGRLMFRRQRHAGRRSRGIFIANQFVAKSQRGASTYDDYRYETRHHSMCH